eukprot:UN20397
MQQLNISKEKSEEYCNVLARGKHVTLKSLLKQICIGV